MSVFRWRGRWAHDYRDAAGVRHRNTFDTQAEAKDEERRLGTGVHGRRRKLRLVDIRRSDCKEFLAGCQRKGVTGRPLSRGSVRIVYSALRAMLNAAVEDELVSGNVAARLGRQFRLQPTNHERQAATEQRVLEPAERKALLAAARTPAEAAWFPLVLTLAREVSDIRFEARKVRVKQTRDAETGELGEPKHGPRLVDLSPALADVLEAHISGLEVAAAESGTKLGRLLFPSEAGTMLDAHNVRRALRRLSKAAGFDAPVTPQDLRHTFGSTLATSELPQYVQQQMGHRDISTTMGTYGSAFNARPRRGVSLMDDGMVRVTKRSASGDKVVTLGRGRTREVDGNG